MSENKRATCNGCGATMIPSDDPRVELICPHFWTEGVVFHDMVSPSLSEALEDVIDVSPADDGGDDE